MASAIIARVSAKLSDVGYDNWSQAELLSDLNSGQRQIVNFLPRSYARGGTITLQTGARQELPEDKEYLISLIRNVNGPAITRMSRDLLDRQNPGWYMDEARAEVEQYAYDMETDPRAFYVYPPQPETPGDVEGVFTVVPEPVGLESPIRLSDLYEPALYHYVLQQAFTKSTSQSHIIHANNHGQLFMQALGLKKVAHLSMPEAGS